MVALAKSVEDIAWFAIAFVFASFVEYWMHRLMHIYPRIFQFHTDHHLRNEGQGVVGEFFDYFRGFFPLMCVMFLYSWDAGISWSLGTFVYGFFAAFAHQLQHENPIKCVWMNMPVHYVHHKYNQWKHNFGLGVDWWDRVFGTYKPVEWLTEQEKRLSDHSYFHLRWW